MALSLAHLSLFLHITCRQCHKSWPSNTSNIVSFHQYADDTRLYIGTNLSMLTHQVALIESCTRRVHNWLLNNGLHLSQRPYKPKTCQCYFIAGIALNNFNVILVRHLASDVELCFCFIAMTTFITIFSIRQTYVQTWNLMKSISLFCLNNNVLILIVYL